MAEYTLKLRRYSPETGEAAYWQEFTIDLDGHRSVLDGILQAKDREDGSIGIRCSCRAAICGSCGVRINGQPALAKAYRFVGDPRDGQHKERLRDLAEDPHGIYDCTHCFNCIEACPKGVAPMSQ